MVHYQHQQLPHHQHTGHTSPRQYMNHRGNDNEMGNNTDPSMYADFVSIDGRFVPANHHQRKKRVPRNIAVKPKKHTPSHLPHHHFHNNLAQDAEVGAETASEEYEQIELKRTNSLKRAGSGGVGKGVKKFFKKMSKIRLGLMYEV